MDVLRNIRISENACCVLDKDLILKWWFCHLQRCYSHKLMYLSQEPLRDDPEI
jgi:hypothetical protein